MTKLGRIIDTERCIGCRSCVAACHVENHLTPDAPWNTMVEHEVGRFPNASTVFTTMACMHCEDAPCKEVCDAIGVKAISKNEYGVVLIDYDKCIGCQYCSAVCPYGAPQYSERTGETLYESGEKTAYELIPTAERNPAHQKKDRTVQKCNFCWHKI
jgi:Fe-S-cluster-containing dehydrogenase component